MTSFEVPCRHCAKSRLEHLKPMTYNTCSKFEYMHISSGPIIDVTPDGVEVIQERDDSGVLTLDKLREAIRRFRGGSGSVATWVSPMGLPGPST